MAATRILAGFSMAEADSVRKAIGKKDMEKMKSIGGDFIKRAEEGWVTVSLDDGSTRKSIKQHAYFVLMVSVALMPKQWQ